jgi:hypothetical protein
LTDFLLKPEIISAEVERCPESSNAARAIEVLNRRLETGIKMTLAEHEAACTVPTRFTSGKLRSWQLACGPTGALPFAQDGRHRLYPMDLGEVVGTAAES